ncbi:MAG: hypothetical protein GY944_15265, partial [bacterium]|nr:hypothetical protein [bacterium]
MTGLNDLQNVKLSQKGENYLELVTRNSGGPRAFRERKRREAYALLALDQIASRLTLQSIDLESDMCAIIRLQVPVPCRDQAGEFHVAHSAVLGLRYRREAMVQPMPGSAFVQLLQPSTCWHPNVHVPPAQVVCLAARVPPGIRVSELVLL